MLSVSSSYSSLMSSGVAFTSEKKVAHFVESAHQGPGTQVLSLSGYR